jgi:hypothetical protein
MVCGCGRGGSTASLIPLNIFFEKVEKKGKEIKNPRISGRI